jgi:two-component sensor histidine kinase
MKAIGGFFELEIANGKSLYHDEAIKLSTARACLKLVLQTKKYSKVYLPFYCCDALIVPLKLEGITFEFYSINEQFEIVNRIDLKRNEAIIYCNFFGTKSNYVNDLIEFYKDQLIIDNSHAFFIKGYKKNISFTTARKYFGVPDGAFLYINQDELYLKNIQRNINVSINHNVHSLLGLQELAFSEFSDYEKSLNSRIEKISIISERLLSNVDFKEVRKIRNRNFNFFRKEFSEINTILIHDKEKDCFCYPLLLMNPIDITSLHKEKIYIPSYWKDVLNRENKELYKFECTISSDLLPLPIDHRYNLKDLKRVSQLIKKEYKKNG